MQKEMMKKAILALLLLTIGMSGLAFADPASTAKVIESQVLSSASYGTFTPPGGQPVPVNMAPLLIWANDNYAKRANTLMASVGAAFNRNYGTYTTPDGRRYPIQLYQVFVGKTIGRFTDNDGNVWQIGMSPLVTKIGARRSNGIITSSIMSQFT